MFVIVQLESHRVWGFSSPLFTVLTALGRFFLTKPDKSASELPAAKELRAVWEVVNSKHALAETFSPQKNAYPISNQAANTPSKIVPNFNALKR